MIAVADINTLWRSKPFKALSSQVPILGLIPRDIFGRNRGDVCSKELDISGQWTRLFVKVPPGWASRLARMTAPYLWACLQMRARKINKEIQGLVVTSPHYLELVQMVSPYVSTYYYCSDDYSQYQGWGGGSILEREALLTRLVKHSFFVSQPLADRAIHEYGIAPEHVSVSPNATDESFMRSVSNEEIEELFRIYPNLRRPLIGVIGAINDRLDFSLIHACGSLPEVGSLVMVGSVAPECRDEKLDELLNDPKFVFVGPQPHENLPIWMQALDVSLIPYRQSPLNWACSPMRLFDHLAAGKPIVASDVNPQIRDYSPSVNIGHDIESIVNHLKGILNRVFEPESDESQRHIASENTWAKRAELIWKVIQRYS